MDIVKISLIGVGGVMLGFLLKGTKPEYASFITMGIGVVILGLAVGKISYLFEALKEIQKSLPVDGKHISTLVKMLGITYIGQFFFRHLQRRGIRGDRRADRAFLQAFSHGF